ncbi:hypothetical protein BV20DRAFT_759396 [Pilatotrama ljubarskyi]|nr:hypothetical protein BV20DRAFT_759396 [Pilatotrama ljubarskyi]
MNMKAIRNVGLCLRKRAEPEADWSGREREARWGRLRIECGCGTASEEGIARMSVGLPSRDGAERREGIELGRAGRVRLRATTRTAKRTWPCRARTRTRESPVPASHSAGASASASSEPHVSSQSMLAAVLHQPILKQSHCARARSLPLLPRRLRFPSASVRVRVRRCPRSPAWRPIVLSPDHPNAPATTSGTSLHPAAAQHEHDHPPSLPVPPISRVRGRRSRSHPAAPATELAPADAGARALPLLGRDPLAATLPGCRLSPPLAAHRRLARRISPPVHSCSPARATFPLDALDRLVALSLPRHVPICTPSHRPPTLSS